MRGGGVTWDSIKACRLLFEKAFMPMAFTYLTQLKIPNSRINSEQPCNFICVIERHSYLNRTCALLRSLRSSELNHGPLLFSKSTYLLGFCPFMRTFAKVSPFATLEGMVEHGFRRGSKQLGFPTANLNSASSASVSAFLGSERCIDGIYVGWVSLGPDTIPFKSALSVGLNPTFADSTVRLMEAHLIDYKGDDFYDRPIRVLLCGWIRAALKFTTIEALKDEIAADCAFASKLLEVDEELSCAQTHEFLSWNS